MTGTGLVYGSLWDNGERGGCQDFIRPLKRAQQMPWHVRSTDAWPHARRRPLSLSLSLSVGDRGSRPSHRFKFAFPARVHRASREVVRRYRSSDPAVATLSRDVFIRAERTRSRGIPSPSSRVGVIPLDARGRCRNDGRTVKNLEAKKSWRTKIGKTFENRRGNLVLGGEIRVCHLVIFRNHAYRGGGGDSRDSINHRQRKKGREERMNRGG